MLERQAAPSEQDGEVVDHVGGLLRDAVVGLLASGPDYLFRLFLHLRPGQFGIGEQLHRV